MKKRYKLGFIFLIIIFYNVGCIAPVFSQSHNKKGKVQLKENTIQEIINRMTIEQKAKLCAGFFSDSISKKVPGAAGRTYPIPEYRISSITMSDGPAGVRISPFRDNDSTKSFYATAFPVGTLLASSWDTSVLNKVGKAMGNEAREYGIDFMLAPGMNIQRDPLGGRNFEYYSEDPLISGEMSAAFVRGMQSEGVGATIKHFFANNGERNRRFINEAISRRAIREIYLKGFKMAIKRSDPWAVMSSYNKVNGLYTSQNKDLLTTILRNEWGYNGFVMSDWHGGDDPVEQMKAGNDLLMPGMKFQIEDIVKAVESGSLDIHILDRNVRNILTAILKTPTYKRYKYSDRPDLKKHEEISQWAAAQGIILLKNINNTLPLKEGKKVALFGNNSYDLLMGGYGSGSVNTAYKVSLNKGLGNAGYGVEQQLANKYEKYIAHEKSVLPEPSSITAPRYVIPQMRITDSLLNDAAKKSDVAIITIGRNSGESRDRKVNEFYLSEEEEYLIKGVSKVFHGLGKNVVVVLNIAGPIDVASWRDEVDGIILSWMPGQEGGNATAEIISGKVNPSGKLAQTFPVKYSDVPSVKYSLNSETMADDETYGEGIYVGYRYYNTFHVNTAYPFGYGLSYTKFEFGNLQLSSKNFQDSLTMKVDVTNVGKVPGKEVVQLYLRAPDKQLKKPSEELKAFAKTKLLNPGEKQTLTFSLPIASLASFNPVKGEWVAEAGKYEVKIGKSSKDIILKDSFMLSGNRVVQKVNNVLRPQVDIPVIR